MLRITAFAVAAGFVLLASSAEAKIVTCPDPHDTIDVVAVFIQPGGQLLWNDSLIDAMKFSEHLAASAKATPLPLFEVWWSPRDDGVADDIIAKIEEAGFAVATNCYRNVRVIPF